MRIVIAQLRHETNTFSPVPTPLERFIERRPWHGREAHEALKGTGSVMGAFIQLAEEAGAEIVLPVAAEARASGPVAQAAYERLAERIVEAVASGCDAVLLDLHGAMVTERLEDGEGELLARLRRVAPRLPIGVALAMRANLFPALGKHATVIAGCQSFPHADAYETGVRVGWPILAMLNANVRPSLAFGHRPLLAAAMRHSSAEPPNGDIQARAREMEADGALCASFFTGFPYADVPYAGASAAVVTDGDLAAARALCDELLDMAWQARERFVYRPEPLERSIARAAQSAERPVVLLDYYDDFAAGGTTDTMAVLSAMIDARVEDACVYAIWDPVAATQMKGAGPGAQMTLSLGGKLDMPSLRMKGKARTVGGRVKAIGEDCVLLDTGRIEIAVTSRPIEALETEALRALGMEPAAKRYVMLKSALPWREAPGEPPGLVIPCAGVGVCPADYSQLRYRRLRRPMYPLDPEA
jgi:microcystin degradation protein MlrC